MARMIPDNVMPEDFHGSMGEATVYAALKSLPKDYIVFYSVNWHKKRSNGNILWGESDFTVFNPKRGILTIEVKSGGIKHDDNGWKQRNTLSQEIYRMKDPLIQAEKSKYIFIDLISPVTDNIHSYWVEAAVWFPSVCDYESIGKMPPAYANEIVMTQTDISSPLRSIERVFNYYGMYEKSYYCTSDINWVVDTLSPNFDAIPNMTTCISEQNYAFNRMTYEQSYLLDYLEEQRVAIIQGGAGTGKTMLAIEKAKRLSATEKVLFLCFNKFLLDSLKNSYSEAYPNINFFNLHKLVCNNTGLSDAGGNEGISKYLNMYDSVNWKYKHIVIDEGQDFFEDHLILLSTIAELKEGCFYVFYDKNQLIQQRKVLEWVNNVECRLVLNINCRNTKSIATTSNISIGIEKIKMRVDIPGNKPNLYIVKSKQAVVDCLAKIIRQYTENGLTRKDIVILTVKTEDSSVLNGISSVGSYKLVASMNSSDILFTSVRKFKGLESAVIIIVDMDEKSFENDESRRVLYVGASRAKHYLELVSLMDDNQTSRTADILQGRLAKNAKIVISSHLKVRIVAD